MQTVPRNSATLAAIALNTNVNAVGSDARSRISRSVRTSASATFGSTSATAARTAATTVDGAAAVRTTKPIPVTFGPTRACAGISGPPAIDIGMYSCSDGVASASVVVAELETTPTTVSHSGRPNGELGGVELLSR